MNTRRELIQAAGRWIVLGVGTAGLAAMVARRGAACERNGLCQGCPALIACGLPEAEKARSMERGEKAGRILGRRRLPQNDVKGNGRQVT